MTVAIAVRATLIGSALSCLVSCTTTDRPARAMEAAKSAESPPGTTWDERARAEMVDEQIAGRGVENQRVLAAMRRVPRHELVPTDVREYAYEDTPLPIGHEQTISQPYIVALMSSLLEPEPDDRVLEIGTGSGYQAAVLALVVKDVYSIEIVEPLAARAARDLKRLGFQNVYVRHGDGYQGWPEHAPFDGIIVTAAPPQVPEPLKQQLAVGGRLVVPVGDDDQTLRVITRTPDGFSERSIIPVRFVPMTGRAQGKD